MKVVITGGGGFLGFQLCQKLRELGEIVGPCGGPEPIDEICLFDQAFSETIQQGILDEPIAPRQPGSRDHGRDCKVTLLERDISDRDAVFDAVDRDDISVFHLASMVSGECEKMFDTALNVNMLGGWHVFEAARARGGKPKVVFASSIASFGGEVMPDTMTDATKRTPQTTYGMTKVIGELMVNDFSRKGFFDGRSARLPTVIIRPGKPNAAASSWASGMFREPLNGEPCYLPVHRDQCHPMTGYREVIDSLIALHDVPAAKLGDDRAYQLPANRVTPNEAEYIVRDFAQEKGIELGMIVDDFNPEIQGIVNNWPTDVDGARALKLGLPDAAPVRTIVENYVEDFLEPEQSAE